MNVNFFGNVASDIATLETTRDLVPSYDFFQKDPFKALELGKGDCRAVALILAAQNPRLTLVKHITKPSSPTGRTSAAYVHYLALDRENEAVLHSTGAPLSTPGAHIKAVHISEFAFGWSEVGERQAKPGFAIKMLEGICNGSENETRSVSKYILDMTTVEPQDYLKGQSMENLTLSVAEMVDRLS